MLVGIAGFLAVGTGLAAQSIREDWKRSKTTGTLPASKLMVFTYSLFLYSPYAFASRMEHAVAMGIGMHYLQYLGLVWLLNGNKYKNQNDSSLSVRFLSWISQNLPVRIAALAAYGALMLLLRQTGTGFAGWQAKFEPVSWFYCFPVALQTVHYFIEAFLWKFSDPYLRQSVLAYLTPQANPA